MSNYDTRTGPQKISDAISEMERRLKQLQLLTVGLALMFVLLLLASCTGGVVTPAPYADLAPEPQPQELACSLAGGAGSAFTLACDEPTPTPVPAPTATAMPGIAFWYFWCAPGAICQPFRVYWDPQLTLLRCAIDTTKNGMKVDVKATMAPERDSDVPLAWVVTGQLLAGGEPCEGWVDQRRLAPAQ